MTKIKSFTLIEILVVIVVVGILSSFILIGMSSIVSSANDSRIKNDINSLQKVLLSYKTLYNNSPIQTTECDIGNDCTALQNALIPSYYPSISSMPRDPSGAYYKYQSTNGSDFTLKGSLSTGYTYQYQYSVGFTEYESIPEERITNGGFETGDTTGWMGSGFTSSYNPHSGSYFVVVADGGEEGDIYQNVNLAEVTTLTFWRKGACELYIDGILKQTYGSSSVWTQESYDVTTYSELHIIRFYGGFGGETFYLDDVSALTN